ncbi:hypothetical protein KW805_02260 [Candidatus Pacearchaeota archaeon]|nr:hypothetical protein [Candidatus Pacearchaeota archaeon]
MDRKVSLVILVLVLVAAITLVFVFKGIGKEQPGDTSKHYCSLESRENDFCTQDYAPVCGWYDPQQIQCIKYPCAQTFSNQCFSCLDTRVAYWTQGECPA